LLDIVEQGLGRNWLKDDMILELRRRATRRVFVLSDQNTDFSARNYSRIDWIDFLKLHINFNCFDSMPGLFTDHCDSNFYKRCKPRFDCSPFSSKHASLEASG
jgi:hypothetical protein